MATVTIRMDEETKEDLEILAQGRNQSLSDLIRTALDGLLGRDQKTGAFDMSPASLSVVDRQQLALLHRILARLVEGDLEDGDRDYQLERAKVLEEGFTREYSTEFAGIYPELSRQDSKFVVDVLELFRVISFSIDRLRDRGIELEKEVTSRLRFDGFDVQDGREVRLLEYASFLVDEDHWSELQETFSPANDRGNSHYRTAGVYQRMLEQLKEIELEKKNKAGGRYLLHDPELYFLTVEELNKLADSTTHPSHQNKEL
ncbi:YfbU family protein (plasmid) [Corynebacterium deserti GIMN1.010]|uniref:YfbU family protein n=1 Tax=Corynebacterium deserti GIMN1.010 TaxID=931089 RepID=A0A0M4CP72_9CORY|nr:YfbU family protein [Corynebacterium deserti]ALC07210.1 YfbU family protein [Corynebacterium deserti GIMN1.010]